MEDMKTLEETVLEEAVQKGEPVKMFFISGYQAMVTIREFDGDVIRTTAHIKEDDRDWLIYRHAVSTIELT